MQKILIIEDDVDLRENLKDILELENFEVITAENGQIGLETAKKSKPNLIICDIMMPGLNGYDVLDALKKDNSTTLIPLIFLTAKAEKEEIRHGMELGADDYLTKPFSNEELLKAISVRLEKQATIIKNSQEELEKLRQSISYALPHELRTTLHGIMGWSQLLSSSLNHLDQEEIRDMANQIKIASERLNQIIENILLYTELEILTGNPQKLAELQDKKTLSVKNLIQEQVNVIARKSGRSEDFQFNLEDAAVKVSELYLSKIVREIVDNALKFSEPGTRVNITTKKTNQDLIITVTDNGIGINEEEVSQIGAYRQFNRKKYEQQGAGLGLIIAQKISELHQGKLKVESVLNKGTKVSIYLPVLSKTLAYV